MAVQADLKMSVPEILRRVQDELVDLEASMETLHPLVDLISGVNGFKDPNHLRAMQGIDHMEQILVGLASFLRNVSLASSEKWEVDASQAVNQITLGDLARRLRLQAGACKPEVDGDLEMFG